MADVIMTLAQAFEPEPQVIARRLRQRDSEFVDQLVGRYHYRLLRYLVFFTSRREQAEDLVQETWIRVLERAGQYNGRSRFEPWLFSIARNLAIDEIRRRQRIEPGEPAERVAPETYSPFVAAAKSEDAARIAAALAGLETYY